MTAYQKSLAIQIIKESRKRLGFQAEESEKGSHIHKGIKAEIKELKAIIKFIKKHETTK